MPSAGTAVLPAIRRVRTTLTTGFRQGASIKAVQQQLGHSSPTVTLNTYAHLFKDDLGL